MRKRDVLVIGNSAAGLVAATIGKRIYPDKKFTVVTTMSKTLIPCGIPYVFGSAGTTEKDLLPVEKMFDTAGIEVIYGQVVPIDRQENAVELSKGRRKKT